MKYYACMCAKLLQLCLTLCDLTDCSPQGSSVRGILQAKNIAVGCHFLLQEIFLTQGLNLCLMSPALAGRFFTTSANWEAALEQVGSWCLSLPVCEMERCQTVSDD